MSREEQWDILNEWEECAVMFNTITEYDMMNGRVRHSPFRIKVLPDTLLKKSLDAGAVCITNVD